MNRTLTVGRARVIPAAPTYQRRQPEHTVLYRTIDAHLRTFLAHPSSRIRCCVSRSWLAGTTSSLAVIAV